MYRTTPIVRLARRSSAPAGLAIALLLSACGDENNNTGPEVEPGLDRIAFFSDSIPPWSVYSPALPDAPPAATADPETSEALVEEVEVIREDGSVETLTDQTYVCTETPYSVTDNPERLVMYNPQASILWAGGLLQGRSYQQLGSLSGLVVDERAPIDVVITGVLGVPGGVSRRVETPTLATVSDAVNDLVAQSSTDDLQTSSVISFEMRSFHSEEEVGLSLGGSGRYLGFKASAGFQENTVESRTTVVAQFYERMFTISVAAPSTPAGFFTDELTGEVIRTKYANTMGSSNPPLYISEVVYGRMLMYSMTSTASESDIRATMKATFDNIGSGGSVNLSARQSKILEESEISVVAIGGDAQNVINLIRTNDLSTYFEESAPLTTAEPLSYTFSTLRGETAKVSETTEYTVRECEPRGTGRLTLRDVQTISAPISGAFTSAVGDFDGDGRGDLVWRTLNANDFFVGYGQADGSFEDGMVVTHPEMPSIGWGSYDLYVADLNGDDRDDLVWVAAGAAGLSVYSAISNGTSWSFSDETAAGGNWTDFDVLFGDFDADDDRDVDLALNATTGSGNFWLFGESDGSGTFSLGEVRQVAGGTWAGYRPAVAANVDNDAAVEAILNRLTTSNAVWTVQLNAAKEFVLVDASTRAGTWTGYSNPLVGDIDGVRGEDIYNYDEGQNGAYVWLSNADGTYQPGPWQPLAPVTQGGTWIGDVGDLNDDGRADLVINRIGGTTNDVVIAYGAPSLPLTIPAGVQEHRAPPAEGWDLYERRILDVNGDGKDDLVWAIPQGDLRIYVGLAR